MLVKPSARLTYRMMDHQDGDLFFELDQDPAVMHFITGGKTPSRDEVENAFIPRLLRYRDASQGFGLWQVNVKQSNAFIGWVLVRPMKFFTDAPEMDNIEIGWRFKQIAWGKGYATEAARQVINALATNKQFTRFSAIAVPENKASIKVMKKLGMEYVRTEVEYFPILGKTDVVCYEVKNKGIIDAK